MAARGGLSTNRFRGGATGIGRARGGCELEASGRQFTLHTAA